MQSPPDWTPPVITANVFSLLSLGVAAGSLFLSIQARHPDVRISAKMGPDDDSEPRLQIQIHNRSLRNIYLEEVHLAVGETRIGDWLWKRPPAMWETDQWPHATLLTYPHMLEPGRKVTEFLNPKQVADFLGGQVNKQTVWFQCCYLDGMDNLYRGNTLKFPVGYWRNAKPRALKSADAAGVAPTPPNFTPMHLPEKGPVSATGTGSGTEATESRQAGGRSHYLYTEDALRTALGVATGVLAQQYSPTTEAGGFEGLQYILGDIEGRLRNAFESGQAPTMAVITKVVSEAMLNYRTKFPQLS